MTQDQFRARFPEFRQVSDAPVRLAQEASQKELDVLRVWKDMADEGQGFLTAHKLSIAYADPQDPNAKGYLSEFRRLQRRVTSGFRVV